MASLGVSAGLSILLVAAMAASGCGNAEGPPRIEAGARCVRCGMGASDLRWAAARRIGGRTRIYDSIECARRDAAAPGVGDGSILYLTDFATSTLHRSESLWVVRADLPSPMGGGFAAFLDRETAERVALERNGRSGRLAAFDEGGERRAIDDGGLR